MAKGSDILNTVLRIYQDFDTTTYGAAFLQEAHDDVLRRVRLYPDATEVITLTAGDDSYALASNDLRIWAATYFQDANDTGTPLYATSVDTLDADYPLWRSQENGQPAFYWSLGQEVQFYPKPDTTTSAGYPNVTLYVSQRQTLVGTTDLPLVVRNYMAWVRYICWRFASEYAIERAAKEWDNYQKELSDLQRLVDGMTARSRPKISTRIPQVYRS